MKTNLKPMFKMLMPQIILVLIIYIVLATIPNRNVISINLGIIIPILMYKVYNKQLDMKNWGKTILTSILWTTGFLILINVLGYFGIMGMIILTLTLITWRIWKGRKLYNYTTKWGADILRGKKTDFDITQLEPDKIRRKR